MKHKCIAEKVRNDENKNEKVILEEKGWTEQSRIGSNEKR